MVDLNQACYILRCWFCILSIGN